MNPNHLQSLLARSVNIPAGGASAASPPISGGDIAPLLPAVLFYVQAPALLTAQLPDGQTLTYTLVEGNDPTFASDSNETVMGVQTGAGGAGAAAAIFAAKGKFQGGQYIGLKITASSTANAAGASVTLQIAGT
jgi:hypothetical protein